MSVKPQPSDKGNLIWLFLSFVFVTSFSKPLTVHLRAPFHVSPLLSVLSWSSRCTKPQPALGCGGAGCPSPQLVPLLGLFVPGRRRCLVQRMPASPCPWADGWHGNSSEMQLSPHPWDALCPVLEGGAWKCYSFRRDQFFGAPWTAGRQAPQSMGFSRQAYGGGLPFPSPGDLPDLEIELGSPALQTDSLPSEPPCGNVAISSAGQPPRSTLTLSPNYFLGLI